MTPTRNPEGPSSYTGPVDPRTWHALEALWVEPFTVSSNFAREYATEIALLASIGWVSVVSPDGASWDRLWRITARGFMALKQRDRIPE